MTHTAPWPLYPLGDLVDVLDGRRVPVNARERARRPGEVPYYGAAGQVGWIDHALFDEDLLLLGEDGVQFFDPAKSKAYRVSGPSWVNNHAHVLRARGAVDWRYLEHYLNWFDYRGFANGTTRLKLTQAAMKRIPVALPGLVEQRRIVDILEGHLSHLDAANDYLEAASRRSIRVLDSALRYTTEVMDAPLQTLSRLIAAPLSNGRSVSTSAGGFPVLRLTALQGDRADLRERKPGAWTSADAKRFLVARGDIFVSRGNGSKSLVGRAAMVECDPDPVAFPDTMIRIRANRELIDPAYLVTVWNSPLVRRQIERLARTTAGIYKVNQRDLGAITLPVPPLPGQGAVQQRVESLRDGVDASSRAIDVARRRSDRLRAALLVAAFAGRLTGHTSDLELAEEVAWA